VILSYFLKSLQVLSIFFTLKILFFRLIFQQDLKPSIAQSDPDFLLKVIMRGFLNYVDANFDVINLNLAAILLQNPFSILIKSEPFIRINIHLVYLFNSLNCP